MHELLPLTDKFWNKVNKTRTCWLWTGVLGASGYGLYDIKNKVYTVSRLSALHHGLIKDYKEKILVCHKCDIRNCVNPKHLFPGTHKDNTQDMMNKKRNKYSTKHSDLIVKKMRKEYSLYKKYRHNTIGQIAKRYGVPYCSAWYLINGNRSHRRKTNAPLD